MTPASTTEHEYFFKVFYLENGGKGASALTKVNSPKTYNIRKAIVNDKIIKLQNWLFQESSELTNFHTKQLKAAVFVYSVTSEGSYNNVERMYTALESCKNNDFVKILVVNKPNTGEEAIPFNNAVKFAEANHFHYCTIIDSDDEEQIRKVHIKVAELCYIFFKDEAISFPVQAPARTCMIV